MPEERKTYKSKRFCIYCGTRVDATSTVSQADADQRTEQEVYVHQLSCLDNPYRADIDESR